MNLRVQDTIRSPSGKDDVCAVFIIDTVDEPFVLHDIAQIGQEYTLSFYAKSDASGSITAGKTSMETSSEWQRYVITFSAESEDVPLYFNTGTYYIYKIQLEEGNKATSWTLAPEDEEERLTDAITRITANESSIKLLVSTQESFSGRLTTTESQISVLQENIDLRVKYTDLDAYSTTAQMEAAINLSANSITQTVSETYTTRKEFNDLEIGGRNFIRNSAFLQGTDCWTLGTKACSIDADKTFDGHSSIKLSWSGATANTWYSVKNYYLPSPEKIFKAGETWTLSLWYYVEDITTLDGVISLAFKGLKDGGTSKISALEKSVRSADLVEGKWTKLSITGTLTGDFSECYITTTIQKNGTIWFTDFKLEKGSKATDWSPAPEDTEDKITSLETWKTETSQKITKDGIIATVGNYYAYQSDLNSAESRITQAETIIAQHADEIDLRVTKDGIIGAINLSSEEVKINAAKITLEGATIADNFTATNLTVTGNSTFSGTLNGATGTFTGSVTATTLIATQSGKIGGFDIGNNYLANNATKICTTPDSVYIGTDGISCGDRFKVTSNGSVRIFWDDSSDSDYYDASIIIQNRSALSHTSLTADNLRIYYNGTYAYISNGGMAFVADDTTQWYHIDQSYLFYAGKYVTNSHCGTWYQGLSGSDVALNVSEAGSTTGINWLARVKANDGAWAMGVYHSDSNKFYLAYAAESVLTAGTNGYTTLFKFGTDGSFYCPKEVIAGYSGANAFRAVYGNYGFIIRNDGNSTYFMTTASGDPYGSWNKYITMSNADCSLSLPNWATFANGYGVRGKNSSGTTVNLIRWDSSNYCYVSDYNNKPTKLRLSQTCSNIGVLNSSGSWITITTGVSDIREKNSIASLQNYKEIVMGLLPKRFKYNDPEDDRWHLGFVAQDVRKTLDNTIGDCAILEYNNLDPDEIHPVDMNDESTFTYSMRYTELIAPHIALTQDHEHRLINTETQIEILQCRLDQAYDEIAKLKQQLAS